MPITTEMRESHDLIVFTLQGTVTARELLETIRSYWELENPARLVLWRGEAGATIGRLTADEARKVASVVSDYKDRVVRREKGRSAIVAPADVDYGLARMIEAFQKSGEPDLPYQLRVFRDEKLAMAWLLAK